MCVCGRERELCVCVCVCVCVRLYFLINSTDAKIFISGHIMTL